MNIWRWRSRVALIPALLWLLVGVSRHAHAADIYQSTAPDGSVRYATQALDSSYVLYQKGAAHEHHKPRRVALGKQPYPTLPQGIGLRTAELASHYAPLVETVSQRHEVNPELVKAVIHVESRYRPEAVSSKGAVGLMQLMPATAARFGVQSRTDPAQNIDGGVRYLKTLLERHKGDVALALASYNAGEGRVEQYGQRIPPYRETMLYVAAVIAQRHKEERAASTSEPSSPISSPPSSSFLSSTSP